MRTANWRQRLKKAFVNSTLYKWEFCLSWHTACELEYSSVPGGELPGQQELVHQAPWEVSWAPWRWIWGQGRCLKGPLPSAAHPGPAALHISRDSPYQGTEQGSSYCPVRWKHLPTFPKLLHEKHWAISASQQWWTVGSYTLYGGKGCSMLQY